MAFQKMVDMARSPAEIKGDIKSMAPPASASAPIYPYGLCLSLDEDILAKLGLDDGELPEVGDMIHLAAMARVTSCSESERENAKGEKEKCCRIELQITHLAAEDEDDEAMPAEKRARHRYGGEQETGESRAAQAGED